MAKHPIIPPQFRMAAEQLKLSPALVSGNHAFLTGVTGADADGQMTDDPETQIRNVFDKIGLVLRHADLTFGAIVEMTSYHIGIGDHFDLFAERSEERRVGKESPRLYKSRSSAYHKRENPSSCKESINK